MKQILQNLRNGKTYVEEVPVPSEKRGNLLIQTSKTLVSAGTERMLVEFGKGSFLQKAKQQPDKVKMVLSKIKTDGLVPTLEAVFNKLDQPLPLGYCNVGTIHAVGAGVDGFKKGDRIVSNGKHAEFVRVPKNLCAKIPDTVTDEEATFTVIGSIALQGIRLANPTLGETIVVMGLGLIGLLAVQLLQAQGCRVIGLDFDEERIRLAKQFGAQCVNLSQSKDPVQDVLNYTHQQGVDAVLVCASTKSNDPVRQAAEMCRKRGRIVLVGVCGLELSRADFYEKELTFQVSCSYGPGRYDTTYEEKGIDYPIGFVRWTEQRNFEAVLEMMAQKKIDVEPLISHTFSISKAEEAYALITSQAPSMGIVIDYPTDSHKADKTILFTPTEDAKSFTSHEPVVSFIGAGNYATAVLLPAFKKVGASLYSIGTSSGLSGVHAGKKFGFQSTTTDIKEILECPHANTIVVATQHDTHAHFVKAALEAKKNVFVEKPLCVTLEELEMIKKAYEDLPTSDCPRLMVGFNRRFAPQVQQIKDLLKGATGPKSFIMTVNAGNIPANHWTQDAQSGGGRIIGEACHFIDLLRFLCGTSFVSWSVSTMKSTNADTVTITLNFEDGSTGTIHYFANGSKAFPKERLEVFAGGGILQLDNFRALKGYGWKGFKTMNLWQQDKGQVACVRKFLSSVTRGETSPIPVDEIFEVAEITIKIATAAS